VNLSREQASSRIEGRVGDLLGQVDDEDYDDENIPPLPGVSKEELHVERVKQVLWSADLSSQPEVSKL
jgi:hypothetical protein